MSCTKGKCWSSLKVKVPSVIHTSQHQVTPAEGNINQHKWKMLHHLHAHWRPAQLHPPHRSRADLTDAKKKEKDAAHLMSDHTQGPQSHPHAEVWMLETKWKSDFVLNLLIFIFTTQNSLEPNFQLTSNFLSCFHSSVSSCCSSQIKRQHPLQLWTLYCSTYTCEPPGAPPCRLRGKHQVVKNEENTRN